MKAIQDLWWWCFRKVRSVLAAIAFAIPKLSLSRPKAHSGKGKKLFLRVLIALSMMLFMSPLFVHFGGGAGTGLPSITYTGSFTLVDDTNGNWRIKFLTSGTLTVDRTCYIDAFLVGGGGGGGNNASNNYQSGGGGGGYTNKIAFQLIAGTQYNIIIGAGGAYATTTSTSGGTGGTTSAFGASATGGAGGVNRYPGAGGSGGGGYAGGAGGSNGSNGAAGDQSAGASGQGTTTREFGDVTGDLYAGGGGAATSAAGGAGGGGAGGSATANGTNGTANTGGGGGGAQGGYSKLSGAGGSGILVIRNQRAA